ncbi:uncharacterized protein BDZ99DRAFT_405780 [Mytilinidion resinicola]|uniref:YMC020W-like alpha/beta hydrolase domain-containing protein n=1 Tax=Mytilinidion resinicola TaxID=574789 RepID=A0A6A6ZA64_9PEZI|nr:uncharacterized protein BDZ99DRAFT_405780 [Mytilinidion resinicola]KAF2818012.1 hypothetical protein BDZ99DRAFT_405780 [Mytilinidion resinicola]
MSPRKKSKPNPQAPAADPEQAGAEPESPPAPEQQQEAPESSGSPEITPSTAPTIQSSTTASSTASNTTTTNASGRQSQGKPSGRKWYGATGSWRSKAPPVAQIARASIASAAGTTSEVPADADKKSLPNTPAKLLSKRKSSKGVPTASMTKFNVNSTHSVDKTGGVDSGVVDTGGVETAKEDKEPPKDTEPDPPLPPEPPKADAAERKEEPDAKRQSVNITDWRSWWSRPDGYPADGKATDKLKAGDTIEAQTTPLPGATPSEDAVNQNKILEGTANEQAADLKPDDKPDLNGDVKPADDKAEATTATGTDKGTQSRSWFTFWSSTQNAQTNNPQEAAPAPPKTTATEEAPSEATPDKDIQMSEPQDSTPAAKATPPKSAGWAFWSRAEPKGREEDTKSTHKQVGELAVADTPSQSRPEAAQFNEQETPQQKETPKTLRGRPRGKDLSKDTKTSASSASTPSKTTPSHSPSRVLAAAAPQSAPKQALKAKQEPPNLLLPAFSQTYGLLRQPTYWQQIREYFLGNESATPHLHIAPSPPRIKRAIAIGVHGYFPAPLLQKVLGQPTGTSIRFANAAAAAIAEWTQQRGYECEIEKVALEGEGFIADRVTTLWNLLLNWTEQIRKADFILVACHSQGVPVAIMLVAKLIHFGCINAARVGICAMAGVNLGPFGEYRTRYLGGTAAELFEFSRPQSVVSQMYLGALDEVLRAGVRIVYVGSIDDQLVSLESSTFTPLSHPYIYRAVFVDGRIHAPDFLTHLVGFAMKLRNLGLPDQGLIRELSPALAGSLYSGEGHSRIYEDPRVYSLAVSHALETTSLPHHPSSSQRPATSAGLPLATPSTPTASQKSKFEPLGRLGREKEDPLALKFKDYESPAGKEQNPYFLPWAMRGLLEEEFVKRELGDEVQELLDMFEEWKPQSKALRDVKFRLEVVRSRL